jgi:hypothetical protein
MKRAIRLLVLAVLTPGLNAERGRTSAHVVGMAHMAAAIGQFPKAIADIHQLGNGKNVIEIYDLNDNGWNYGADADEDSVCLYGRPRAKIENGQKEVPRAASLEPKRSQIITVRVFFWRIVRNAN